MMFSVALCCSKCSTQVGQGVATAFLALVPGNGGGFLFFVLFNLRIRFIGRGGLDLFRLVEQSQQDGESLHGIALLAGVAKAFGQQNVDLLPQKLLPIHPGLFFLQQTQRHLLKGGGILGKINCRGGRWCVHGREA